MTLRQSDRKSVARTFPESVTRLSLRDPAGHLFRVDGRLLRVIHRDHLGSWQRIFASKHIAKLIELGKVVQHTELPGQDIHALCNRIQSEMLFETSEVGTIIEHRPVGFPSFPHEWAPEMLYEAGKLTLDIAQELVPDHIGLKDAAPSNILFESSRPLFVDVLSFEMRDPNDPSWLPFSQFLRTFVNPLLMNRFFSTGLDSIFLSHRDGLEPEEVYRTCRGIKRFLPPCAGIVTIPTWLGRLSHRVSNKDGLYSKHYVANPDKAAFILKSLLKHLRKCLESVRPKGSGSSTWSGYIDSNFSFTPRQFEEKSDFVAKAITEIKPNRVLDVGANTGHFSLIAARAGSTVVAIDSDPVVVGRIWKMAFDEDLDILPLVMNFSRPSPSIGWRNREIPSFLERASGKFDLVVMLAVIHHIMLTDGIPLPDLLKVAQELTKRHLIVEFVGPNDKAFKMLCRGRNFSHITQAYFERECAKSFDMIHSKTLTDSQRTLYLLRKKELQTGEPV